MKETNIEKYFTKKEKNVDINIRPLFINCIISIFSLCFLMDFYYFYHLLIGEKTLEKILFIIMLGVGCVFVIALRYSFYLFVGTLAPKYELLLILGIKTRDFWTLVTREYLLKVFLLGIREIIISNIMCIIASYIIFLHNISIVILLRQMVVAIISTFFIYTIILLGTLIYISYSERKKNLIDLFERLTQDERKKSKKGKNGLQVWKLYLGSVLVMVSFTLLVNFKLEKMLLAILFNFMGVFFLTHLDSVLLKKILKRTKKIYYKKCLIWTDILFQYKKNADLIFILYILNFVLVYFMGGLFVSLGTEEDFVSKYPYETIVYSDENTGIPFSYNVLLVDVEGYGDTTAISNSTFNDIKKVECSVNRNEALLIDERQAIDLDSVENEISIIDYDSNEEYLKLKVKDVQYSRVFGENIFPELNTIIVINDDDFKILLRNKVGKEKVISLVPDDFNISNLNKNEKIWNRTKQLEQDNIEKKIVMAMIFAISLIMVFEGQGFIFTKQIVNLAKEKERYNILRQLGIREKDLQKIITKKIYSILVLPGIMAIINGAVFFGMDVFQNAENKVTKIVLLEYILVVLIFAFIEYLGSYMIRKRVQKLHEKLD